MTIFFIVQRHGWVTMQDYVTQKDQSLLTSLPFNKRPFSRMIASFHACWHVGIFAYNFEKAQITLSKILSPTIFL